MNKLLKFLRNLPVVIAALALTCAVTIMVVNVITRYFFSFTFPGYEEIIVICFSYTVFLGGAAAYFEGNHYSVDALVNFFPRIVRQLISIAVRLFMIVSSAYLTRVAWQLSLSALTKRFAASRIPYFYFDLPACICFGLIMIYTIIFLYKDVKTLVKGDYEEKEEPVE